MGITIHYYTQRGAHLDPASAEGQYRSAVRVVQGAASTHGWAYLGEERRPNEPYTEWLADGGPRTTERAKGTVISNIWDPGRGCESLELLWVEGTGILPYCFVKTQFADRRALVHAQICDLLEALNRDAFDGRLVVHDEGGYLPGRSLDALAQAFGENEALIRALLGAARDAGLTVTSPLDEQDARTDTDTDTHPA